MKRFDAKKQRRKERRNDKALEEFSKSAEQEREATVTIGNRQVRGVLRKKGPLTLEFTERLPAGSTGKPVQLELAQRDNYFKFSVAQESNADTLMEAMQYADSESISPDGSHQGIGEEGHESERDQTRE